jgi:hypothetical protein
MHWTTYTRLIEEGEAIEQRILESASVRFGMPLDALT